MLLVGCDSPRLLVLANLFFALEKLKLACYSEYDSILVTQADESSEPYHVLLLLLLLIIIILTGWEQNDKAWAKSGLPVRRGASLQSKSGPTRLLIELNTALFKPAEVCNSLSEFALWDMAHWQIGT
jgi:hypothetical protein